MRDTTDGRETEAEGVDTACGLIADIALLLERAAHPATDSAAAVDWLARAQLCAHELESLLDELDDDLAADAVAACADAARHSEPTPLSRDELLAA